MYNKEVSARYKEYRKAYYKKYWLKNKDTLNSNNKTNRENQINSRLLRKYGISLDEYNKLVIVQNNLCAICKKSETKLFRGKPISLAVDHDHKNGKIRGLLCYSCNLGLGLFKDNIDNFKNVIQYLG